MVLYEQSIAAVDTEVIRDIQSKRDLDLKMDKCPLAEWVFNFF